MQLLRQLINKRKLEKIRNVTISHKLNRMKEDRIRKNYTKTQNSHAKSKLKRYWKKGKSIGKK